jgi:mRNA interferase RelE/StbE
MPYLVLLHPRANMFLEKMDRHLRKRIEQKLKLLASDPEVGVSLKYSNFWKLRIGDHRAIYEIDPEAGRVVILFIGNRKDVYDDFSRLL